MIEAVTGRVAGGNSGKDAGLRGMLVLGGILALLTALGSSADVVIGMMTGGNVAALPQTAVGRFEELLLAPLLGLYNLDLLNLATTLLMLPAIYAAYLLLRKSGSRAAGFALAIAILGAAVFTANNAALPMLGLSGQYASAMDETHRALLAAAGEAILAKGVHGGMGVIPSFLLPLIANIVLCGAMLRSRAFSRLAAWLGLVGNGLLAVYLVLVTFLPEVKTAAAAFAAPGGLMAIAWMVMTGLRLLSPAAREID